MKKITFLILVINLSSRAIWAGHSCGRYALPVEVPPETAPSKIDPALVVAAKNGDAEKVKLLLDAGHDPDIVDDEKNNALAVAAENNHQEVAKILIDAKADLDLSVPELNPALHRAVIKGHKAIVTLLLDRKAQLETKGEFGCTPLIFAAGWAQIDVLHSLIRAKADLESTNHIGKTALINSACWGHDDAVNILLNAKANANHLSNDGRHAADWIVEKNHTNAATALLVSAGSVLNAPALERLFGYGLRNKYEAIIGMVCTIKLNQKNAARAEQIAQCFGLDHMPNLASAVTMLIITYAREPF